MAGSEVVPFTCEECGGEFAVTDGGPAPAPGP